MPIGTVDSSISSALGCCSPPSTTIGMPVSRIRAKPGAQVLRRAEDPADDQVAALDRRGHRLVAGPRRVGPDVVGARRAGGEQVGVGRGQQRDAHRVPPRGSRPVVGRRSRGQCLASPGPAGPGLTVAEPPRSSHRVPVDAGRTGFLSHETCPVSLDHSACAGAGGSRPGARHEVLAAIGGPHSGSTPPYQTSSGCTLTTGAWLHGNWHPVSVVPPVAWVRCVCPAARGGWCAGRRCR